MNKNRFIDLVRDPGKILRKDLAQIEEISSQFPYSQILHILEAKGSAIWNPKNAQEALFTAAAYCRDRALLKEVMEDRFLETALPVPSAIEPPPAESPEEIVTADTDPDSHDTATFDWIEDTDEEPEVMEDPGQPTTDMESPEEEDIAAPEAEEHEIESQTEPETDQETAAATEEAEIDTDEEVDPDKQESLESELESMEAESQEAAAELEEPALDLEQAIEQMTEEQDAEDEQDQGPTDIPEVEESAEEDVVKSFTSDEPAQELTEDLLEQQIQAELGDSGIHSELMANLSKLKQSRELFTDPAEKSAEEPVTEEEGTGNGNRNEQIEIIDNFIKNSPVLSKPNLSADSEATSQKDLSKKSTTFNDQMVTEQLAKIMIKPGNQKEAIKIYKKLITKFPKKKSYFADQIENLSK